MGRKQDERMSGANPALPPYPVITFTHANPAVAGMPPIPPPLQGPRESSARPGGQGGCRPHMPTYPTSPNMDGSRGIIVDSRATTCCRDVCLFRLALQLSWPRPPTHSSHSICESGRERPHFTCEPRPVQACQPRTRLPEPRSATGNSSISAAHHQACLTTPCIMAFHRLMHSAWQRLDPESSPF